jgi:Cyclic nucleotide-binding domain
MSTPTPVLAARRTDLSTVRHSRMGSSYALAGTLEMMGAAMSFSRNQEIYGEGEPADYLYKVVRGAVRMYKVLNDGRRQIGAFYLPGDMFGLEAGAMHASSAEAIGDSTILVFKRSAVLALSARDADIARELLEMTARELQRAHDHMLLLIKSAQERVASFLMEMAGRGCGTDHVEQGEKDVDRGKPVDERNLCAVHGGERGGPELSACEKHEQEGNRHVHQRTSNGDEKLLARGFRDARKPRHAADRQQGDVGRRHPEGAGGEDVPEFMRDDARKQQHHKDERRPGGLRPARGIARGKDPAEKQQESDMHADRRSSDRSDVQGPGHETSSNPTIDIGMQFQRREREASQFESSLPAASPPARIERIAQSVA